MATQSEPSAIPTTVTLSKSQMDQIDSSIKTAIRVLAGQQTLQETDNVLGSLTSTRAPKGPGDKLVVFYSKSVDGRSFYTHFTRKENKPNWLKATVSAQPDSHPKFAYDMKLDARFFADWELEKADRKIYENKNSRQPEINVFVFRSKTSTPLRLTFEAFASLSDLNEKFPTSFYSVEVEVI